MCAIYLRRFLECYWKGNYNEALKCSKLAYSQFRVDFPGLIHVLHSSIKGMIAFQKYKMGEGDSFFDEGREMLDEMELWLKRSEHVVKPYVLLLRAELLSSSCEIKKAKVAYREAIRTARDYCRLNDQAVAYEAQGHFLSSIVDIPNAMESFKNAYECYMSWGAVTLAKKIQTEQNLEIDEMSEVSSMKHGREWT